MSGASLTITDDTVQDYLERLRDTLEQPQYMLAEMGEYGKNATQDRFAKEEGPDGVAWAPLSQTTIDRKGHDRKLWEHGFLAGGMAWQIEPGGNAVSWGTNKVYAAVQQYGMAKGAAGTSSKGHPLPWGNIPPRPYLGIDGTDREELADIARQYLLPED